MSEEIISELIRAGESQSIEFASAAAAGDVGGIGRTVCGFISGCTSSPTRAAERLVGAFSEAVVYCI